MLDDEIQWTLEDPDSKEKYAGNSKHELDELLEKRLDKGNSLGNIVVRPKKETPIEKKPLNP